MNLLFLVLFAFLGAGGSIVGAWPWLGVAAILLAPIGGAVACAASAAFLFALSLKPQTSVYVSPAATQDNRRPQQQPGAGAKNLTDTGLKRSA